MGKKKIKTESAQGTPVDNDLIKGHEDLPVTEQEMTEEEYQEHMGRLRKESISRDFNKVLKRVQGSKLYGRSTDLGDLQEMVVVSYALGMHEGRQAERDARRFKYTRPQGRKNLMQ